MNFVRSFKLSLKVFPRRSHFCSYTTVTLQQLHVFSKNPSEASLLRFSQFLHKELPLRLSSSSLFSKALPQTLLNFSSVKKFLKAQDESISLCQSHKNPSCFTEVPDLVKAFITIKNTLDTAADGMLNSLQHWKSSSQIEQAILNDFLDKNFLALIGLRVMVMQIAWMLNFINKSNIRAPIVRVPIGQLIDYAISEASSIVIEKLGESPKVHILGQMQSNILCVESYVVYVMVEILKNSMKAVVENNPNLPDIQITVEKDSSKVDVTVVDGGGGFQDGEEKKFFEYFFSTALQMEPTYTYSGSFGAPLTGLGVGLPMSRLYCRVMGGDLSLKSEGKITKAQMSFSKNGGNI